MDDQQQRYCEEHTTPQSDFLYSLYRWTNVHMANPHMLSGPYQGTLLRLLTSIARPRVAVEVGCFVGYSTICIAQGLPEGGVLHAIEVDEEYAAIVAQKVADAGLVDKVNLHVGPALQEIPNLPEAVDFAFIDADKDNTAAYYDLLADRLSPGGLILVDNVLWSGRVADPEAKPDRDTLKMRQFNDHVQSDPRVENILLPVRDGLMLCRKI